MITKPISLMSARNVTGQIHIVGLDKGDAMHNCNEHGTFGKALQEGDLVVLRQCIIAKQLTLEKCIAVVELDAQGNESCRVGFVPKDLLVLRYNSLVDRRCDVKLRISNSDNRSYRAYSYANHGAAEIVLY